MNEDLSLHWSWLVFHQNTIRILKKKKKKDEGRESGKWQFNTTRLSHQLRTSLWIHEFFTCPLNKNNEERLFHQGKCYFKIQWAVLWNFKPEFTVALVKLQWPPKIVGSGLQNGNGINKHVPRFKDLLRPLVGKSCSIILTDGTVGLGLRRELR